MSALVFLTSRRPHARPLWKQYRTELEARGEVLAWDRFIPPAIRDEENFFSSPSMLAWFARRSSSLSTAPDLFQLPAQANLDVTNLEHVRSLPETTEVDEKSSSAWPKSRRQLREWSERLEPSYRVICQAAARPQARLNTDYSAPAGRGHNISFSAVRSVVEALAAHANLAWLDHQPDVAMQDLQLLRRMAEISASNPTLVGAMIEVASWGVYTDAASAAFEAGLLRDPDLAAIQKQVAHVNLLAVFAHSVRGERAAALHLLDRTPREVFDTLNQSSSSRSAGQFSLATLRVELDQLWLRAQLRSDGWVDRNTVALARTYQDLLECVDSRQQRIHVQPLTGAVNRMVQNLNRSQNRLAGQLVPNFSRAAAVVAKQQVRLKHLETACALERYRLSHGAYPDNLERLVPEFLETVPKDLFSDSRVHYRITIHGYLVWSVGWNERNDGGMPGPMDANGRPTFSEVAGDWVWTREINP